ncbi:DoxX family protein [Streptomyces sp. DH37]|uniref:DoxX family protein n=1 Tax=Streptomyces sp. DH37 TaxID=3040122 RepID=UPI00244350F5|nr:DoxX family protein [Streptomyces sp. DH37]MDG9701575.1 DoxX family protein [Streptomyces sp. DH37]
MERAGGRSLRPPRGRAVPEGAGSARTRPESAGWKVACAARGLAGRVRPRGPALLRVSVGTVFLWFGVLKFFPATSPAEGVAVRAATKLTLGLLPPEAILPLLAVSETAIGFGLVTGVLLRVALVGFFAHMAGVFSALVLLSGEMWQEGAPIPTMEGQYVIKNVVLVVACLVVAADEWGRAAPR